MELSYSKFRVYNDALQDARKKLDEVIQQSKSVNSDYQKYLEANPYKGKKQLLSKKKKQYIDLILRLVEVGCEKYNPQIHK